MQQSKIQQADAAHELVSALADGELQGEALAQALAVLQTSTEAQACWHGYHLVGDVMRAGAGAAIGAHDPAFVARLRVRLQAEDGRPPAEVPVGRAFARSSAN
ncbi:sigma-E factor negative regulatory protein, partial [Acinetobacter baumannii]|uniref:sigma-E factor negative regulatory protein n=1 Tax=Acinetobacter baumannii TaxID=470 RepID=UPI0014895936